MCLRPNLSTLVLSLAVFLSLACQGASETGNVESSKNSDSTTAKASVEDGVATQASRSTDDRPPIEGVSGGRASTRETLVVIKALDVAPIRDEVIVSSRVESDISVAVFPKLTGLPITNVTFDEGESVQQGDILMTLYDTELRLAEQRAAGAFQEKKLEVERQVLMLKEEDARIIRAERAQQKQLGDLDRLQGLVDDGLVNMQEVADARLEAEHTSDDLNLSRFKRDATVIAGQLAQIAQSQAEIDWKRAQEDLQQTEVRAPVAGVVAERHVETGELSSQGEMAFRIVDITRPTLELRVPQDAMDRLKQGQSVEARSVTGTSQTYRGTVRRVNPVLDRATGSVSVLVDLEPAAGLAPGLFCEARIVTEARDAAVLIDKRAVRYDDDQPIFFALNEDGTSVKRVPFVAGASTAMQTEILSILDGAPPEASMQVVVVGNENLKDGDKVRVEEAPY